MHYAEEGAVSEEEMELIIAALEMQQFSMGNTLLQFCDTYYHYGQCKN